MRHAIFWPVVAQVALVAAVWVRMYVARLAEMRAWSINPQSLATSRMATKTLENVSAADNFRNLFEVPVLFYVVCCALAITDLVTPLQLTLAWGYVALRAAHSLIHVTYNRVTHRFVVYALSTLDVFAMWGVFAVSLLRSSGGGELFRN